MVAWKEKFVDLIYELESAKNAHFQLENYRTYPDLQNRFQTSYTKYLKFSKVLRDEARVHDLKIHEDAEKDRRIYAGFALDMKEKNRSVQEMEEHLIKQESLLLEHYRDVLAEPELPAIPDALLQSQAEELHERSHEFKLDYLLTYPMVDNIVSPKYNAA